MELFYVLLPIYVIFTLWLGFRIVHKAGFKGWWVLVLLIPIVNVAMIWVFAFIYWPNLKVSIKPDL